MNFDMICLRILRTCCPTTELLFLIACGFQQQSVDITNDNCSFSFVGILVRSHFSLQQVFYLSILNNIIEHPILFNIQLALCVHLIPANYSSKIINELANVFTLI